MKNNAELDKSIQVFIITSTPVQKGTFHSHVKGLAYLLMDLFPERLKVHIVAFKQAANDQYYAHDIDKELSGSFHLMPGKNRSGYALRYLKRQLAFYDDIIVHAQNYYPAFIAALLKPYSNMHLHADIKGIVPEESLYFEKATVAKRYAKFILARLMARYFFSKTDTISTVSNQFAQYLKDKYGINKPIYLFPSIFNPMVFYQDVVIRDRERSRLHIEKGEILVAFVGYLQNWQALDYLAEMVKASNGYSIRFMLITKASEEEFYQKYKLFDYKDKIIVDGGSPETVNRLLNAADYGYLIRWPNIVNQVASPTKFAEYVATGNRILISPGVGDFTEFVQKHNLGLVIEPKKLPPDHLIKMIINDHSSKKENFADLIRQHYSTEALESEYQKLYNHILGRIEDE